MSSAELSALDARLSACRHRALIWVSGERSECDRQLAEVVNWLSAVHGKGVVIGNRAYEGVDSMPSARAGQLLGRTLPWAVYDAFSGFNPNSFAQLAGTLAAGGWLVLISPAPGQWTYYDDPEYRKLLVEPWTAVPAPRYLDRLVRLLEADRSVLRLTSEAQDLPDRPATADQDPSPQPPFMSVDQQKVVEHLVERVGRRRCALVLGADRGRGKSAAIGLALVAVARSRALKVLVTAPSRQALTSLFERVEHELGALTWQGEWARAGVLEIGYLTPSEALKRRPAADLLVIDEAAAVATPILSALSGHYPRLIFATTQHGYEGNGRGFTLRFLDELKRLVPGVEQLQMRTPVRWAPGDPLEQLVSKLLLLDAEPEEPDPGSDEPLRVETLDRDRLLHDEPLLRHLFGLLILAHYRTTPGDLRVLLDSPNLQVHLLMRGAELVGCALIAREGELSEELARGVWEGHRRPTGHLLPQALIAHEGELAVAPWCAWRVLRIAVHPRLQRQGLGGHLLNALVERARREGVDYMGAGFAATRELLGYWRHGGFLPVRVGDQLDPVSGAHSVLVLNPLSARCLRWFQPMRQRYADRLRYRLSGALGSVSATQLPALFADLPVPLPTAGERVRLVGFAEHLRSLESTLLELDRLLSATVQRWPELGLGDDDQELLVARVWRQLPAGEVARPSGRNAQLQRLREVVARLLKA